MSECHACLRIRLHGCLSACLPRESRVLSVTMATRIRIVVGLFCGVDWVAYPPFPS